MKPLKANSDGVDVDVDAIDAIDAVDEAQNKHLHVCRLSLARKTTRRFLEGRI